MKIIIVQYFFVLASLLAFPYFISDTFFQLNIIINDAEATTGSAPPPLDLNEPFQFDTINNDTSASTGATPPPLGLAEPFPFDITSNNTSIQQPTQQQPTQQQPTQQQPTLQSASPSSPLDLSDLFSKFSLKNLSNNNGSSITPTIYSPSPSQSVGSNSVYVLWSDNSTGNFDVMLAKSNDGGVNFEEPINLSENLGSSITPTIYSHPSQSVGSNSVYVLWSDNSTGNFDVMLAKSNDGGVNFEEPINLSENLGSSITPTIYSHPSQSAGGNSVYVLWSDNSTGNFDVMLAKSNDGGVNFDEPINISLNPGSSFIEKDSLVFSTDEKSLYVVWVDDSLGRADIYFKKISIENETTRFGDTINLSNNFDITFAALPNALLFSSNPVIEVIDDKVNVIWEQHGIIGNREIVNIHSKYTNDTGGTFSRPIDLSSTLGLALNPKIAVSADFVYIIWQDNAPIGFDTFDIFAKVSEDKGKNFSQPINLSGTRNPSVNPDMTLLNGGVGVVWQELTPIDQDEIFFKKIGGDNLSSASGAAEIEEEEENAQDELPIDNSSSSQPSLPENSDTSLEDLL
jgi:hypothetical protein